MIETCQQRVEGATAIDTDILRFMIAVPAADGRRDPGLPRPVCPECFGDTPFDVFRPRILSGGAPNHQVIQKADPEKSGMRRSSR